MEEPKSGEECRDSWITNKIETFSKVYIKHYVSISIASFLIFFFFFKKKRDFP